MTEAQKYEAAITCISRLAEGRNPGTGEQIDDPILEDLKVVRCLYFAEKVLTKALKDQNRNEAESQKGRSSERREIPEGEFSKGEERKKNPFATEMQKPDGIFDPSRDPSSGDIYFGQNNSEDNYNHEEEIISRKSNPDIETIEGKPESGWTDADRDPVTAGKENEPVVKKKKVPFPFEILSLFIYREDKSITHLLRQFAEPAGDLNIKLPNAAAIHKWFGANGYLVKKAIEPGGKEFWMPTEKGKELGMYTREGYFKGNRIVSVMFDEKAQYFLAENLEKIVNSGENNMP